MSNSSSVPEWSHNSELLGVSRPPPKTEPEPGSESRFDLRFGTFSPSNAAAIHILDLLQACSPPNQDEQGETIDADASDSDILYILSLPQLPSDSSDSSAPRFGTWRIGAGPPPFLRKKEVNCEVEFLLCPPGNTRSSKFCRQFIGSVHAVLYLHP